MANNIISAVFSSSNITYTKPAYQYDYGMILKFSGIELPQAYEVHFSNTEFCGESISQIGDESGVTIPDEMFLSGNPIYAWTFLHTGEDDGETVYKTVITINKRAQPSDIEPTPVQQDVITQAIAALNTAVEQTAADVVAAGESAEAAAGSAEAAGQAKDDAVEAKDKAVEAKNAAETAQGKAEDAQRAAERAAGSVLGLTADASVDANVGTPSVEVEVSTVSDHKNMSFAFHNLKGVQGDTGVGISSVVLNADYTLTITLTNGTSYTTSSIRGEVGATPNLTIGTISTLPEGSQATATITGTPENPVLNLGIPVGDTGDPGISPTITVTEISGGHNVEITDAQGTQDFDVMDGEVSEQDLEDALIDKADVITSTASGEIVTISDGGKDLPVVDLSVSLLPVQDLHGQSAPYPAGGGKNLLNVVSETAVDWYTSGYSGYSVLDGGIVQITGTALFGFKVQCSPSTQYTVSYTSSETYTGLRVIEYTSEPDYIRNTDTFIVNSNVTSATFTASATATWLVVGFYATTQRTLSKIQLEKGSSATSYAPYSNVCPISGWTGVEVYRSDADTSNPTTYPISWQSTAGTVYGCNIDPVSGVLKVDKGYRSFTGQEDWSAYATYANHYQITVGDNKRNDATEKNAISSHYKAYEAMANNLSSVTHAVFSADGHRIRIKDTSCADLASFKAMLQAQYANGTPVEVCYVLDTKVEYQLTPTQIATFLGNNSFWSNGNGVVDLEYRCDTKLYIEQLTKPSEDDMVANANIASGKFFMVGNRLMLSTTAIAQGEQIVVGTNCSEVSLADALNQINA